MSDQPKHAGSTNPRIDAALREYLERVDRGEAVDAEKFIAQHLEIASELRSFIDAEDQLRKLAAAAPSQETADRSTQSLALHGLKTVAPQAGARQYAETGGGLTGEFGRYQIVRALGKGAMGAVYLAADTQLQRQVALKTPHFELEPTGELLERFYREARAAATLRHPNICPVFDVGQIEGTHYISMAYIEGHPLSAFIRSSKQQPERQILIVVRKLAQALEEAHDHGIVHRDLKPANIMVDKRNEPIIMDFGLARQFGGEKSIRLTQSGMLIGTPAYMSPEQVEGEPEKVGPPSDQYSLGVILYELLTGQLPFRGSLTGVMAQILTKEAPPPGQLRPGLDARIEAACLKMMAKNPDDRFASLKAVADELAAILRSPQAKSKGGEGALMLGTDGPGTDPARSSQIIAARSSALRSTAKKSLGENDLASLEELVGKRLARRDYDQVIQIVERIPPEKRPDGLAALLAKARDKADEIAYLICEIEDAVRLNDVRQALRKADELLQIKPGQHRALKVKEEFAGYGAGGAARFGLRQFSQPWSEGGWIPWSLVAFGFAVFAAMTGVIIIWMGRTAIVIDAKDPDIEVAVRGQKAVITVPGRQSIQVEPGDQEIKVRYAGMETETRRLTLKRGQTKTLTVEIVDSKLIARIDGENLEFVQGPDEKKGENLEHHAGDGGKAVVAKKGGGDAPEKNPQKNAAPAFVPTVVAEHDATVLTAPFDEPAAKRAQQELSDRFKAPVVVANSIGMQVRLIPAGQFVMGSGQSQDSENPIHTVRISRPFYMGTYEVTRREFARFVSATNFKTDAEGKLGGWRLDNSEKSRKWDSNKSYTWRQPGFPQEESHPVIDVSWQDARAFCTWLSKIEGKSYRLPTEAEWEYACRAGTTSWNYGGGDRENLSQIGNVADAAAVAKFSQWGAIQSSDGWVYTSPVGQFRPNNFGLFDMLGNAMEWCSDWSGSNYYRTSPQTDPIGPPTGTRRIHRGGWYGNIPDASERWDKTPAHHGPESGFRVVCEIPAAGKDRELASAVERRAADDQVNDGAVSDDGFLPLFNGRDLTGWKTHARQVGNWRVENGALIGSAAEASHLYTERADFKDFDLRVQVRINDRGNSGIDFRTPFGPRWPAKHPIFPFGYEAQIDGGSTAHKDKTGSLFVMTGTQEGGRATVSIRDNLVPAGQWFTMEVIALANHIVIKVDGREVVQRDDSHFTSGHIGLQQLGPETVVEFRKIEIRVLPTEARAASSVAGSPDPSFFNGKNLAGWQGLPGFWHVKNQAIVGSVPRGKKAHTFLCSRRSYTDFDLKFRARLAGGLGNSGVQFRSQMTDRRKFIVIGPQCEICGNDPTNRYPAGSLLTEPHGKPDVAPPADLVHRIFKEDDFNDFEIRCVGKHVQITVNGQTTVNADFPSMPDEGIIAWQMHGSRPPREVVFKDIELTDLSRP